MESKELKSILEKDASTRVLEHGALGRSGLLFVRVAPESVRDTLLFLRDRFDPRFEWLEHLGASDQAGAIVLNYFLRTVSGREDLVLRCSLEPGPDDVVAQAFSVRDLYAPAAALEAEIGELFGVRFALGVSDDEPRYRMLPPGLRGFPMRKGSGGRA